MRGAPTTVDDRFWSKVDMRGPGECWPWVACTNNKGYGRFNLGRRGEGVILAHRMAFRFANGRDAEPNVLHECDHPLCCNPAHLFDGTQMENIHDAMEKGRLDNRGQRNGMATLIETDIHEIKASAAVGTPNKEIAARYGVTERTIRKILQGTRWGHVS